MVKLVPVPKEEPPEEAAYQFIVPALAEALKLTVPAPHLLPPVTEEIEGDELTVAVTAVREAVVQPPLVAST